MPVPWRVVSSSPTIETGFLALQRRKAPVGMYTQAKDYGDWSKDPDHRPVNPGRFGDTSWS